MRTHTRPHLSDSRTDISSSAHRPQAGPQVPLGGCQFQLPIPAHVTLSLLPNLCQPTQIHLWAREAECAPSRPHTGTRTHTLLLTLPSHHLEHPSLATESPSGPWMWCLAVLLSTNVSLPPSWRKPQKQSRSQLCSKGNVFTLFPLHEALRPVTQAMKHFEASQRYLCSWPNGLPAWTSLGVAFISLAADIFKLAHLLSTCIYK